MTEDFNGKSAWVTGAGGGIGRECAFAFARRGAVVAVVDRNRTSATETLELIQKNGGRGLSICADVTDENSVAEAFNEAVKSFGRLDFAVNNAGISQSTTLTADISRHEWNRIMQVNVTGVWLCMRMELRHMSALGTGSIVNMASIAGLRSLPMQSAYVASKHAVVGLTKNAAVEYAAKGLRINAVVPGAIPTSMMEATLTGLDSTQRAAALEGIANLHPMRRIGTTREIANGVIFLCSDQATFITGICLPVDGGWCGQ